MLHSHTHTAMGLTHSAIVAPSTTTNKKPVLPLPLPRTRHGCDDVVPPMVCQSIRDNNAAELENQLRSMSVSTDILQLAFRYAALLGDDVGMQVIAQRLATLRTPVPEDAFSYARDTTSHAGLGGHTLAAVYARSLFQNHDFQLASQNVNGLKIVEDENTDWKFCCRLQ